MSEMSRSFIDRATSNKFGMTIRIGLVLGCLLLALWFAPSAEANVATIASYLYGSLPFAYFFTYVFPGRVKYEKGAYKFGVANAFRLGGLRSGVPTVTGEISKALLPLAVSYMFFHYDLATSLILVFASFLGTNYPVFLSFRGGMGGTIIMWSMAILATVPFLIWATLWVALARLIKSTYYSTIINYLTLPPLLYVFTGKPELAAFAIAAAFIFIPKFEPGRDEFRMNNMLQFKKATKGAN